MSSTGADGSPSVRFSPTSGTTAGWIGLVFVLIATVWTAVDARTVDGIRWAVGLAVVSVLIWCLLLRPRVVIARSEVELRNMFASWHVPLADIRKVSVRAVTSVHTGERRYDGVAVGRPIGTMRRGRTPKTSHRVGFPGLASAVLPDATPSSLPPKGETVEAEMVADLVTEQILAAAAAARSAGARPDSPHSPARRSWAVPELVALAVLVLAFVAMLFL